MFVAAKVRLQLKLGLHVLRGISNGRLCASRQEALAAGAAGRWVPRSTVCHENHGAMDFMAFPITIWAANRANRSQQLPTAPTVPIGPFRAPRAPPVPGLNDCLDSWVLLGDKCHNLDQFAMANTRGSTASELPNLVTLTGLSHGFSMALIEIDGLPMFTHLFTELKNGWIFPWQTVE